jgi:hypothetical protein
MRTGRNRRRQVRETHQRILDVEDSLRDLREKVKGGADTLSAARSAAFMYIDLLDRACGLSSYVGAISIEVFEEECPLKEKMPRVTWVLQINRMVTELTCKVVEGFLACFGGEQTIAVQAIVEWIGRQGKETSNDAAQRGIDLLAKILTAESNKRNRR